MPHLIALLAAAEYPNPYADQIMYVVHGALRTFSSGPAFPVTDTGISILPLLANHPTDATGHA